MLCGLDLRQDLRHAVDIGLAADEAGVGKGLRFRDQMLAAAESDFEPDIVERRIEQLGEIGRRGLPMSSARCGSRCSIRSAWCDAELVALAAPEERAVRMRVRHRPAASRSPISRVARHRSVWYSRCSSRARGSIDEMYICS